MDVFRIGLIGAGSIGTRHIKAIDELALIELVAIADPAPAADHFFWPKMRSSADKWST